MTAELWTQVSPAADEFWSLSIPADAVVFPGVDGSYASTPDSAANSSLDGEDLRVLVSCDDWTPLGDEGFGQAFMGKWRSVTATNQRSYLFHVTELGALMYRLSSDGVGNPSVTSTAVTGFIDGTQHWVRVTRVRSSGLTRFWTGVPNSAFVVQQGWDFSNTTDGWTPQSATLTPASDRLTLTSNTSDGAMRRVGLSLNGSTARYITARIRQTVAGAWEGKVYYANAAHPEDENFRKQILAPTGMTVGGAFVTAVWDMHVLTAGGTDWKTSTITGIRFDFSNDNGAAFEIDWIAYGEGLPAEGIGWTQLGTDQTLVAGSAPFDSSSLLEVGAFDTGTRFPLAGRIEYAELRNGVDGPVVSVFWPRGDADPGDTSWVSRKGETWTLNGTASVVALNTETWSTVTPAVNEVWIDAIVIATTATFSGVFDSFATTPDSAALDITGDLDIRALLGPNDWTPGIGLIRIFVTKFDNAQRSYRFELEGSGGLTAYWTTDGNTDISRSSSTVIGAVDGTFKWVRWTLDVDNGAGGNDTKFWTSLDYNPATRTGTWTQLGITQTVAGTTSIFSGSARLMVGSGFLGSPSFNWQGSISYVEVRNGIDGTVVSVFWPHADASPGARSWVSGTGETWTLSGDAAIV